MVPVHLALADAYVRLSQPALAIQAVRAGLKAVLGSAKDIEVIGEGSTGKDAISLAERLDPDVIVMDLSMGEMDGAEATKELVGKKTRGKVLILTMHAEDSYLVPLLEAGAVVTGWTQRTCRSPRPAHSARRAAASTSPGRISEVGVAASEGRSRRAFAATCAKEADPRS